VKSRTLSAPNVNEPPVRDPVGLWKDGDSSAWVRGIPRTLLFGVSGPCAYTRIVDLCGSIGVRWNPGVERLVVDLTNLRNADEESGRFMASQLSRMAYHSQGSICVVRVPPAARNQFRKYLGGGDVCLVYNLLEAILR